jgi:hypothetical protein
MAVKMREGYFRQKGSKQGCDHLLSHGTKKNRCGTLQCVQTISARAKPKNLAGPQKKERRW